MAKGKNVDGAQDAFEIQALERRQARRKKLDEEKARNNHERRKSRAGEEFGPLLEGFAKSRNKSHVNALQSQEEGITDNDDVGGESISDGAVHEEQKIVWWKKTVFGPDHVFSKIVHSRGFELSFALLAFGQCVALGVYVNCITGMLNQVDDMCSASQASFLFMTNAVFVLTAIFEGAIRILVDGIHALQKPVVIIDMVFTWIFGIMLFLSSKDLIYPSEHDALFGPDVLASGQIPEKARSNWWISLAALRVVRVLDSVRYFSQFPIFKDLWVLVRGAKASFKTLCSSTILLSITVYIFAVIGVFLIGHVNLHGYDNDDVLLETEKFDSLTSSVMALMRVFFLDNAFDMIYGISEVGGPIAYLYFACFLAISTFVVSNVMVAVIIENALEITEKDLEVVAQELNDSKEEIKKAVGDMFMALDQDNSGFVTFEEFIDAFAVDEIRYMLQSLDFDEKDLLELFKILDDDGEGQICFDEFIFGMSRLQGDPRSKDFLAALKLAQACGELADDILNDPSVFVAANSKPNDGKSRKKHDDSVLKQFKRQLGNVEKEVTLLQHNIKQVMAFVSSRSNLSECTFAPKRHNLSEYDVRIDLESVSDDEEEDDDATNTPVQQTPEAFSPLKGNLLAAANKMTKPRLAPFHRSQATKFRSTFKTATPNDGGNTRQGGAVKLERDPSEKNNAGSTSNGESNGAPDFRIMPSMELPRE